MNVSNHRPAVLLDRDGVINRNRTDYVKSWDEFEFLPGSLEALRMLAEQEAKVVVVTNQSAVGRGIISPDELERIHARMNEEVEAHGGRIDAVLCCPHAPDDGCHCRKPRPGLLLEAMDRFQLDPNLCYAVGDSLSDLMAARAAGLPFVMVLTGRGRESLSHPLCGCPPSWVASDLRAAAGWILRRESYLRRRAA
ncbi:MAG: D-glycero-beta-D-manno-heptose 1,7-bisphosphate 7-phosphatase [Dehalococcoidia bacterium]|nr:D-glycero-beta-D-manno-heptose 1,7-bisphosphate 7-phosphatase [Dehalococcoidia bacterium]